MHDPLLTNLLPALTCADVLLQGYVHFMMTEVKSKLHSAATQEYSADASICCLPFEQVQRLQLRRDNLIQVRC
jgi:hypothetical protein